MSRLNIGSLVRIKYSAPPPPPEWVTIHTEDFESGWFVNNTFNSIFIEDFESWFTDNIFNLLFNENFEDPSWNT